MHDSRHMTCDLPLLPRLWRKQSEVWYHWMIYTYIYIYKYIYIYIQIHKEYIITGTGMKGTQAALMLMNRQPSSGNNILNTTYIFFTYVLIIINPPSLCLFATTDARSLSHMSCGWCVESTVWTSKITMWCSHVSSQVWQSWNKRLMLFD